MTPGRTSDDSRLDVQLSMPKAVGGDDGPGTSPEQMFAAGFAACFHGAVKAHARERKIDVSECAISVTIGVVGDLAAGYNLTARIEAQLPGVPNADGEALLRAAHETCPYSRATHGNVTTTLSLIEDSD